MLLYRYASLSPLELLGAQGTPPPALRSSLQFDLELSANPDTMREYVGEGLVFVSGEGGVCEQISKTSLQPALPLEEQVAGNRGSRTLSKTLDTRAYVV